MNGPVFDAFIAKIYRDPRKIEDDDVVALRHSSTGDTAVLSLDALWDLLLLGILQFCPQPAPVTVAGLCLESLNHIQFRGATIEIMAVVADGNRRPLVSAANVFDGHVEATQWLTESMKRDVPFRP